MSLCAGRSSVKRCKEEEEKNQGGVNVKLPFVIVADSCVCLSFCSANFPADLRIRFSSFCAAAA